MKNENGKITNFKLRKETVGFAKKKVRLRRMAVKGVIIAMAVGLVGLGIHSLSNKNVNTSNDVNVTNTIDDDSYTINTSTDDLSSLNVVLVNDGIDDEKINKAQEELNDSGLNCEVRNINELNKVGNECFIAFTDYNGPGYKVIANYNDGNNHADLLAVGMSVAFDSDIEKGVKDISMYNTKLVPSDIENEVGNQLMPNVTIAVSQDKDIDTDKLLEGLARYNDYFRYGSVQDASLLYRTVSGDSAYSLGSDICTLNGIGDTDSIREDEILQARKYPNCFQKTTEVVVSKTNVHTNANSL